MATRTKRVHAMSCPTTGALLVMLACAVVASVHGATLARVSYIYGTASLEISMPRGSHTFILPTKFLYGSFRGGCYLWRLLACFGSYKRHHRCGLGDTTCAGGRSSHRTPPISKVADLFGLLVTVVTKQFVKCLLSTSLGC
jgi:hypothetical protein